MAETSRDLFASRLGMLAATLGSSVGLGNIWKFPALTGEHGGASFLLVYILSTLVVGLPLMIAELLIGRSTRSNAYQAFKTLSSNRFWWIIGGLGIAGAVTILSFYSDVAGWVFAYIPKALTGSVHTQDPAVAKEAFSSLLACPWKSLFWQWLVLGLTASVILRGASGGIEKATAMEGLKFLFMPDFSRIDGSVVLMAMGLAFFKMSIGFGCMITYGSYFRSDTHVPFLAVRVMVCDLLVSILAGIAVFPAVFSFGFEPTAGTSLLFLTIPAETVICPLRWYCSGVPGTCTTACYLTLPYSGFPCSTCTISCLPT